jgi:hypothetical protein
MKNLISAIAAALLAVPAFATPSLESAQASALKSFQSPPALKLSFQKGAKVKDSVPGKAVIRTAGTKGSYVRVSGHVYFNGSGYVSHTPGYVSLHVNGSANICDSSGQVCSGYTTVSTWANVFVNGNYVSDWLRPNVSVSFYKGGRYVGSGQISGSIPVSGFLNGDWVHLSGSGYLSGDVFVNE